MTLSDKLILETKQKSKMKICDFWDTSIFSIDLSSMLAIFIEQSYSVSETFLFPAIAPDPSTHVQTIQSVVIIHQ